MEILGVMIQVGQENISDPILYQTLIENEGSILYVICIMRHNCIVKNKRMVIEKDLVFLK